MEPSTIILTRWALPAFLAVAILYSLPGHALIKIGHVIFTTGSIQAVNNGISRPLKKGSPIQEGDVIKSGSNTRSQIRMIDDALIALSPNTEFGFEKYHYLENDDSNSSFMNLIKGGFRTISGLIGNLYKQNYQVQTIVATIGIRGTHYGLTICQEGACNDSENQNIEDGLYGSVIDGEISAKNNTGEYIFSNDEYFHVASISSKPRGLIKPPGVIFALNEKAQKLKKMKTVRNAVKSQIEQRQLQQASMIRALALAEQREIFLQENIKASFEVAEDSSLSPVSFVEPAQPGNLLSYSYTKLDNSLTPSPVPIADTMTSDGTTSNQFFLNSAARENGLLIPIAAKHTTVGGNIKNFFVGNGTALEPKSTIFPNANVAVGWGRWSAQYAVTSDDAIEPHLGQLHYIVASSTTSLAQLGGLTGSLSYTSIGGTRATDLTGNIAANVANVTMGVTFGSTSTIDSLDVLTRVGGGVYEGSLISPVSITNTTTSLGLAGGSFCTGCTGEANISFFGPAATGAGATYTIKDNNSNNTVNGAAILLSQ